MLSWLERLAKPASYQRFGFESILQLAGAGIIAQVSRVDTMGAI